MSNIIYMWPHINIKKNNNKNSSIFKKYLSTYTKSCGVHPYNTARTSENLGRLIYNNI